MDKHLWTHIWQLCNCLTAGKSLIHHLLTPMGRLLLEYLCCFLECKCMKCHLSRWWRCSAAFQWRRQRAVWKKTLSGPHKAFSVLFCLPSLALRPHVVWEETPSAATSDLKTHLEACRRKEMHTSNSYFYTKPRVTALPNFTAWGSLFIC